MYCILTRKKLAAAGGLLLLLALAAAWLLHPRTVSADTESEPGVRLPIIMYHSILKDPAKTGKYVITPKRLEEDLMYLRGNGYETVVVADLIAYVESGVPLP